jgi:hypothetical protein
MTDCPSNALDSGGGRGIIRDVVKKRTDLAAEKGQILTTEEQEQGRNCWKSN